MCTAYMLKVNIVKEVIAETTQYGQNALRTKIITVMKYRDARKPKIEEKITNLKEISFTIGFFESKNTKSERAMMK